MTNCAMTITDDTETYSAELAEYLQLAIQKKHWYIADLLRLELSKIVLAKQKSK